ncbi:MAG: SCO family protein, partial [Halobacteriales archaeon]
MKRRRFLSMVTASALVGATGCLGGDADTVLSPPENYETLSQADLPRPIHGERLPEATVEAPLRDTDTDVSTRGFVGDRHVLMTFIYTRCTDVCLSLTANLVQAQVDAVEEEYSDEIALLPTTFDPGHDTADVLREYGDERGADVDADNWYFLRPDGEERAREVVDGTFGVAYERNPPDAEMEF